jgi:signal peptidase I
MPLPTAIPADFSWMKNMSRLQKFLFPDINLKLMIRVGLVALVAISCFTWILIPFRINGYSMEPTYQNGSFNFCNRLHYLFSSPSHSDVVAIRYSGTRVMLLKRILAVGGETLEFRNGQLFVDGKPVPEPYVVNPYDWDLEPRTVNPDHVYVVGDNRQVPMLNHDFGQTPIKRIAGAPLW